MIDTIPDTLPDYEPYPDYEPDYEYDYDGYCNCPAVHDDTELGMFCCACGGIVE